jgi:hypothetical protein
MQEMLLVVIVNYRTPNLVLERLRSVADPGVPDNQRMRVENEDGSIWLSGIRFPVWTELENVLRRWPATTNCYENDVNYLEYGPWRS